jgi:hypothetical protein
MIQNTIKQSVYDVESFIRRMFFLMTGAVLSQIPASVTLTGCYDSARVNYTCFQEKTAPSAGIAEPQIKNLNASWYPQVSLVHRRHTIPILRNLTSGSLFLV